MNAHSTPGVWLAGPDGVGKTTLAAAAVSRLAALGHAPRVVTIWDAFVRAPEEARLPFSGADALDRYLVTLDATARFHFLMAAWTQSEAMARAEAGPTTVFVLVGTPLKYAATELAYGADPGAVQASLDAWAARQPAGAWRVRLEAPQAVALARKARRSRYESGLAGRSDPETFQAAARRAWEALAPAYGPWTTLDATASPDAVAAELASGLDARYRSS